MAYLNKIMIIGNVGNDAEVRNIQNSDRRVASFNVATTRKYRDRSGELREETQWHKVVYWIDSQSRIAEYIKKGKTVYVEGEMTYRTYKDASGTEKTFSEIKASTLQLLSDTQKQDNRQTSIGGRQYNPAPSQGYQQQGFQQSGNFPQNPVNNAPIQQQVQQQEEYIDDMPF